MQAPIPGFATRHRSEHTPGDAPLKRPATLGARPRGSHTSLRSGTHQRSVSERNLLRNYAEKGDQKLERAALKYLAPLQGGSEPAQMPGSAALRPGSLEVGAQYRSQCRHVFDDRPASFQRVGRAVVPTCIGAEHEERIPDELTGRAVGVGEGLADALIVVPVVDRAPVDEQVGDVEAVVERHHGEPDDVDTKVGIWISLEDLRLHRTGAALADASGWRQQQEQSWLSAVRVEGGLQRVDALQFGDLPRLRGTARRLLRSGASGEQERGEGRYDKPCPHGLEGIGVNSDRLPSFPGRRRIEVENEHGPRPHRLGGVERTAAVVGG